MGCCTSSPKPDNTRAPSPSQQERILQQRYIDQQRRQQYYQHQDKQIQRQRTVNQQSAPSRTVSESSHAPTSSTLQKQVSQPGPLYKALYDYAAATSEDLAFRKGEQLYIINASDGDWWLAQAVDSGKEGFVPSNYVAKMKTLEAEEWVIQCCSSVIQCFSVFGWMYTSDMKYRPWIMWLVTEYCTLLPQKAVRLKPGASIIADCRRMPNLSVSPRY